MSDGSLRNDAKEPGLFRFLLISFAGWMSQQQRDAIEYLREENRVLRTQFGGRRLRFTDDQRRSLAAKAKLVGRKLLADLSTIVTPETLLKWHRDLIACKYDGSKRRHPGRPAAGKEIEELVVRMARENRSWGYLRICGALSNLGYEVSRNTIANILKRNGIESAPERVRKTTWKEFLTRHWELLVAPTSFGGLDSQRTPALLGSILHRTVDAPRRDCRHLDQGKCILDESNRPQTPIMGCSRVNAI